MGNPLLADRNGIVWAGTWGGGLARVSPGWRRIKTLVSPEPDVDVTAILEDRRGRLWVGRGVRSLLLASRPQFRIVLRHGFQPRVRRLPQVARLRPDNAELHAVAEHRLPVELTVAVLRNDLDRVL